jgi:serine/threonine-protein kinase TNNI3K
MSAVEIYLEEVLGVGSYGKVCKAKCGELPCAAKLLHDTMFLPSDPEAQNVFLKKFEQECLFLSSIKHPNIVQYLASVRLSQSNMPALLMELMDESLTKFLERSRGPLPYHTQLGVSYDVALALAYLHSNSLLHRDLSSNNVLVIGNGVRAKVTDFGMSRMIDTNPQLSLTQCPGTLVYMPPEALTIPPVYSDKLDCFSHGVLTIQIITRNFPSPGDAHKQVEDSNYPNQQLFCQIPETDRRAVDLNLVQKDHHTLFPMVLDCLKNMSSERPSAVELCVRLTALKRELRYKLSLEQAKIGTVVGETISGQQYDHLQELQLTIISKDKVIEEYQAKLVVVESEKCQMQRELELKLEASSSEVKKLREELEEMKIRRSGEENEKFTGLTLSEATTLAPSYKIQKDKIHPFLERKKKRGEAW